MLAKKKKNNKIGYNWIFQIIVGYCNCIFLFQDLVNIWALLVYKPRVLIAEEFSNCFTDFEYIRSSFINDKTITQFIGSS